MSEAHRKMVESAIQSLSITRGGGEHTSLNDNLVTIEVAENQLASLGFQAEDIQKAIVSVSPGDGVQSSELLDWLCLHLPEHRLPASFKSGPQMKMAIKERR